jgi:PhnB protein
MSVNYSVGDVAEAERVFEALADGGKITTPLAETFWSPKFGMCVDRFGTPWMVNAEPAAESS